MADITPACAASDLRDGMRVDSRACCPLPHVTPDRAPHALMPVIPAEEKR